MFREISTIKGTVILLAVAFVAVSIIALYAIDTVNLLN
jgi:hypothetical protein